MQTAVAIGITARFARQKAAFMGLELSQFDLELELDGRLAGIDPNAMRLRLSNMAILIFSFLENDSPLEMTLQRLQTLLQQVY